MQANDTMTSINELFPKCRKLAYDSRQQLAQVQHGNLPASELYLVLEELQRQLDCMDQLSLNETPANREMWKRKIAEIRQESTSLRQQGQAAERELRNRVGSYQREREELMLRRRKRGGGEESEMNDLADEGKSLDQSHLMVNELLNVGEASLTGLVGQRQRLRGVRRVLGGIDNRLGLSQSTMRIIERRDITDAYLVAAGMVVTCLVIYFVWF